MLTMHVLFFLVSAMYLPYSLKPGSQYDIEPSIASRCISTQHDAYVHVGAVHKCNAYIAKLLIKVNHHGGHAGSVAFVTTLAASPL